MKSQNLWNLQLCNPHSYLLPNPSCPTLILLQVLLLPLSKGIPPPLPGSISTRHRAGFPSHRLQCLLHLLFFSWFAFFFRIQLELIPLLNKLHLGADCHRPQEKMHLAFAEINIVQQCPSSSFREVNLSLEEGLRRLPH